MQNDIYSCIFQETIKRRNCKKGQANNLYKQLQGQLYKEYSMLTEEAQLRKLN